MPISPIASGRRIHTVTVQNPGLPVRDGKGGYTQTWTDASPATWRVAIEPASARELERLRVGTVISTATHIITGPYHSGVGIKTRLVFGARTFAVLGFGTEAERGRETQALCSELVS